MFDTLTTRPHGAGPHAGAAAVLAAVLLAACASAERGAAPPPRLGPGPATPGTLAACSPLAGFAYAGTLVASATPVPAGSTVVVDGITHTLPEYCHVQGRMNERTSPVDGQTYAIRWEMRLPKDWNGRLFFQPNGGNEGTLATPQTQAYGRLLGGGPERIALGSGFAVVTTDSGHDGAANTTVAPAIRGQVFGRDPAARTEHAHGYVATVTPMAKSLVKAAYGKPPDRSYMVGCSNGGRVGMVTASRYPELFDGVLAGAPAFNLPSAVVAAVWNAQAMATVSPPVDGKADLSRSFTSADMNLVAAKVLERCDALDGAADGLVFDAAACRRAFSLARDVPACSGGAPDGSCLSAAQKTVLDRMMSGPRDSAGKALYSDWPYDPGIAAPNWRTWQMGAASNAAGPASAKNPTSLIVTLTGPSMAFMFTNPPQSTQAVDGTGSTLFDYVMAYRMDSDAPKVFAGGNGFAQSPHAEFTPPDLSFGALGRRGGKLIVFHGAGDGVFSMNDTTRWYRELLDQRPGATAYARYFQVPGMSHCSAGPATDRFDLVSALVDWVERGEAPERVIATARPAAQNPGLGPIPPGRTRPLCAWPKVAHYSGSGSLEDAANFVCR